MPNKLLKKIQGLSALPVNIENNATEVKTFAAVKVLPSIA